MYDGPEKAAHAKVGDAFHKLLFDPILETLTKDSAKKKGSKGAEADFETASASFRYALRAVLLELLGSKAAVKAFLVEHWESSFELLEDAGKLDSAKGNAESRRKNALVRHIHSRLPHTRVRASEQFDYQVDVPLPLFMWWWYMVCGEQAMCTQEKFTLPVGGKRRSKLDKAAAAFVRAW